MYSKSKTITVEYEDHDAYLDNNGKIVKTAIKKYKDIVVNVNIHNESFNASVDESVGKLETLTGAIVGFKTANVAVKKANEQVISGCVTSGFLNMIEQNINLQNAGMEADMHALAGELTQQCKELIHKHEVMTKDFNRIKSRYSGLFETINKEFKNRMQALINPCFGFVSQVRAEQERRANSNLLSMATIGGKETDSARIAIQSSKMKHNAKLLIGASKRYIDDNRSMNRAFSTFSIDGNSSETFYAPVVVMSGVNSTDDEQLYVFLNSLCNAGGQTEKLVGQQCSKLRDGQMSIEVRNLISSYFNQLLDEMNDGSAEIRRIIGQMRALYEQNNMRVYE